MSEEPENPAEEPLQTLARAVLYLGACVGVGLLIWSVRSTLTIFLVSFFFAYLLDPAVALLQRRGLARGWAIGALVIGVSVAMALVLALLVPFVSADMRELGQRLPARLHALGEVAPVWIEDRFGVRPPEDLGAFLRDLATEAKDAGPALTATLKNSLSGVARGAATVLGKLVQLFLIPLFAFYLLHGLSDFKRRILFELVPPRWAGPVAIRLDRIDLALSGFVRGQLTVCACLAVLYTGGLLIGGVPLAFVIGPLAGLFSLVPFLGVTTFLVLGLLTAALEAQGYGSLVAVAVTVVIAQILEGLVLTPRIVGSKVGLSAFGVLLSVAFFGELLGFLGVLLAVPLGATIKILWPDLRKLWRDRGAFKSA